MTRGSQLAVRKFPLPETTVKLEEMYLDLEFPMHSADGSNGSLPYVAMNMVRSLDGRVQFLGKSGDIGGSSDRRVMRNLRSRFDAVIRGASTLRAEKISSGVTEDLSKLRISRGLPEQPYEVLVTKSGKVPVSDNLLNLSPRRTLILSSTPRSDLLASSDVPVGVEIIEVPKESSLVDHLKILRRDYGIERLLSENGPTLNEEFLESGLVREIFLTLSPKLLGASTGTSLGGQHDLGVLVSAYTSDCETFLHYRVNFR